MSESSETEHRIDMLYERVDKAEAELDEALDALKALWIVRGKGWTAPIMDPGGKITDAVFTAELILTKHGRLP